MIKRDLIKYVRDRAKSEYKKENACFICASTEKLDFHHFYSLTELFNKWLRGKQYKVVTVEDILEIRDEFIADHYKELYEDTVTICHSHHLKLHSIYGKNPSLATAEKQRRWVQKQREKHDLVG